MVQYDENGVRRDLGDGRAIWLIPQLFGSLMLCIGATESEVYDDQWQYQNQAEALRAFVSWQPNREPEPPGWYRHPASGRRRPGGDPAQEHVLL